MSFVIAYVPTVEEVEVVKEVQKLPHPYFPLKKYNFQQGGLLHINNLSNKFQAVITPPFNCEFKGVHLNFTSYNIEDTYDLMIGGRYLIKDSHVKEMSEYRLFETYEVVSAGTPIVLDIYNNSFKEKYLMYDAIMLMDSQVIETDTAVDWSYTWDGNPYIIEKDGTCTLIVSAPNYVNSDTNISTFVLDIVDTTTNLAVATITYNGTTVITTYNELIAEYIPLDLLARVNTIGITDVLVYEKSMHILFKNLDTIAAHSIEMRISGTVHNI